jgi:hypothetical protein
MAEVYVYERAFNLISSDLDITHLYLECEHARTPKDLEAKVNIFTDHYYMNLTNEISNSKYDKRSKLPSLTFEDSSTNTYTYKGIYMISKNKESDFYREVLKLKFETMPLYKNDPGVASPFIIIPRTYPWEPVWKGGFQYAILYPENFKMRVNSYASQNNKRIVDATWNQRKGIVGRCKMIDEETFAEEIDQ